MEATRYPGGGGGTVDPAAIASAIAADPDLAALIVNAVSEVATDSEVASAIAAAIAAHAAGDASDAELAAAVATLNTALGGKLSASLNLSDLASAGTARSNLGLGTAATHAHGDYDAAGAAAAAAAASQPISEKGQPDGYASLGSDGLVPAEQLPEAGGGGGPVAAADVSVENFTDYLEDEQVQAALDFLLGGLFGLGASVSQIGNKVDKPDSGVPTGALLRAFGGGSGEATYFSPGEDGQVLVADSGSPDGIRWADPEDVLP